MKDTYSVREFRQGTAAAIRTAEMGTLVTITRRDRPVAHVISSARLGRMLETMELLADPDFVRQLRRYRSGKLRFYSADSLSG